VAKLSVVPADPVERSGLSTSVANGSKQVDSPAGLGEGFGEATLTLPEPSDAVADVCLAGFVRRQVDHLTIWWNRR
jgi:hypothetical protein